MRGSPISLPRRLPIPQWPTPFPERPTRRSRRCPRRRRRLRPGAAPRARRHRRRCGGVSAGPAVVRRQARSRRAPAASGASIRPKAGCSPISCCGAMRGRTTASRMLLSGDIAESVAKRLRMYVLRSKVTIADVSARDAARRRRRPAGGGRDPRGVRIVPELARSATRRRRYASRACRASVSSCWRPRATPIVARPLRRPRHAGRLRCLALAHDPRGNAGRSPPRRRMHSSRRRRTWTSWAASISRKAAIRVRRSSPARNTSAASRNARISSTRRRATWRAGDRIYSSAFEGQPCGTVVNAAPAPGGGSDLLAVLQIAAAERGDARLRAPDGPRLAPLPLPYAIPAPSAPRGRSA